MKSGNNYLLVAVLALGLLLPAQSEAHGGRRFEVKTESQGATEKLYTRGYISTGSDDGGGITRPYRNAIHDHWSNVFGAATAALPGMDVLTPGGLEGHRLDAELVGVTKWVDPPLVEMGGMMMVPEGTIPDLQPLSGENLFVSKDAQLVTSGALGTLVLDTSIAQAGEHLDLVYGIDLEPSGVLYALEWILSTDAPGIADSDSVYAILAPAGTNMTEKMHVEALYLEEYLGGGGGGGGGGAVPEPSAVVFCGLVLLGCGGLLRFCRR